MARPIGAGVLTIVGGFFILIGGFVLAVVGAIFAALGFFSGFFFIGLAVGALTIVVGLLMLFVPSAHVVWGILAIVFSLASFLVALGGLFLGFLLTLIGGILALTWKPPVDRVLTVEAHVVPPPG